MGRFPDDAMYRFPTTLQRQVVVHLSLEIAILAEAFSSDRLPELCGDAAALALLELCLAHASWRITRPAQPLIEGNMPGWESAGGAGGAQPITLALELELQEGGTLRQAYLLSHSIDGRRGSIQRGGELMGA